jgi:hypothetical protein
MTERQAFGIAVILGGMAGVILWNILVNIGG